MKYVFKKPIYKILIPLFDALGSLIFFPIKFFKKPPSNPKNILVVRLDHIGDFVCTTPIFENLKKRFPDAKITILINSASKEMAYRNPNIDKVITFSPFHLARNEKLSPLKGLIRVIKDVGNIGFDLGFEPRGDLLSILIMWLGGVKYRIGYGITGGGFLLNKEVRYDKKAHIIDRNLALLKDLNIPIENRSPAVYFNEKDTKAVEDILKRDSHLRGQSLSSAIVLHPFAGARAKEWPFYNFQKVINILKEGGHDILLVGSKDDHGVFENIVDLRGKINLPQLAYLIKGAALFIGLDSGPANMAAALGVPSVIVCSGTNVPQLWIPKSDNVRFVYKDVECRPCEKKICPKKEHLCMNALSVSDVINAIDMDKIRHD